MATNIESQGEFEDYVCGGYFIVKVASNSGPVDFCDICKATLPPGEVVTLSTCLTVTLPNSWALDWVKMADEKRLEKAEHWGLSGSDLNDFIRWTTERFNAGEIGYPNVLLSLKTARELLHRFLRTGNDWRLLGLGLRRDEVESFVSMYTPTGEGEHPCSVVAAVSRQEPLDPAGCLLGYEVLGLEVNAFHSWFCSLAEKDVIKQLGLRLGADGLLKSYSDGVAVAGAVAQPHDAFPGWLVEWYPWAVSNYPI